MNGQKPAYLLAGGNTRDIGSMTDIFKRVVREIGLKNPRVAYLGVANGDSERFFQYIYTILKEAGASEVTFPKLAATDANLTAAREALRSADAIYISGGEVEDGMRWLERHGLVGFLKELYSRGKFFFGMSAGTIMMGRYWVRWDDPEDDSTAQLFDCLGFIPATFDTHAEDEDWKELKMALKLQGPGSFGYAIPSGGLISADSQGRLVNLEKAPVRYENKNGRVQKV